MLKRREFQNKLKYFEGVEMTFYKNSNIVFISIY